jgi:hypothetical protein
MNPWEKYASQAAPEGGAPVAPWEKYKQQAAPAAPLDRLPPETSPTAQPQKNADDIAHRILGLGEAGLSAATGAVGGAAGQLYGIGKTLTSGKYGTQAGIQEGERAGVDLANKLTYQPRTQTGQQLTEGVGKALETSRLQGLPVEGGMIGRIPEIPGAALRTAEGAADINRAVGRTAAAPARALGRGAVGMLPPLEPETQALARQAHELGFRLSPHEVYGSKYGKYAGELAQENPLIATNREFNQRMFNHQLVYQLGGEGDKLTRRVFNQAMNRSGSTIGDIAASHNVPFNEDLVNRLSGHVAEAQRFGSGDVERVVRGYVDEITDLSRNGELPGQAFRRINTRLNNHIRGAGNNGDLRNALGNLQDDLQDAFTAQLTPEELTRYNTARRQYAVGKTLEPLVAKAVTGDVAPASLLGAITRTQAGKSAAARGAAGELGTLADIGQRFLKSQPSSGTAERSVMQNLMTHPVGSLAAGATAAATSPLAAAYNRLGPRVTQQLIDRPPVQPPPLQP